LSGELGRVGVATVMDCFKILSLLSPEVSEKNKESHFILYLGPVVDTDKVHLCSVSLLFHFCLTYRYFMVILLWHIDLTVWQVYIIFSFTFTFMI
jgi:hypothetical protein